MRRILQLFAIVAATSATTQALADGEQIAVFTKNQVAPFHQVVRAGTNAAARKMNAAITHYIPNRPDSIIEQMSLIESAIIKRPDAILFTPVDYQAMIPGVRKVNKAGIPIVNVDDRSPEGDFVTYVGASSYEIALETGRYLLRAMGGKGNVVIIEGVKGAVTSVERVRGFKDAIKEFPQVKLIAAQAANYQRLEALQVTENLLQAHPVIDGIMVANDGMATGVIEALGAANRKALVVGLNGDPEGIAAVKSGQMLATAAYDGFLMGCLGVMSAIRHLQRQPVPKEIVLGTPIIDKTSYQPYDVPLDQRQCPDWEKVVTSAAGK
ncbi:sugar ABC transporter substrate-binding protein [Reyranella sp. CPCC 100927]|uniref:sugar ABC transporter substrate-binding protein n=1 Tax=Reyranella sp. CPCC 100927 TaxID=2599616 RepID=UPI0011B85939|nr:sugar ABC transporter substrate-binding protein [Reyranella sp. CPCC 100927]TWT10261.1 sugar ABC transporter substrate-binding protein [Reyranella sp. CPCC 100927]